MMGHFGQYLRAARLGYRKSERLNAFVRISAVKTFGPSFVGDLRPPDETRDHLAGRPRSGRRIADPPWCPAGFEADDHQEGA